VDELAEGVVGVTETLGRRLLGQTVQEDGAEGFILSLGGTDGLVEEALTEGIVHVRRSECEVIIAGNEVYTSGTRIRLPGEKWRLSRRRRRENEGKAMRAKGERAAAAERRCAETGPEPGRKDLTQPPATLGETSTSATSV
jgi:hypothetical protein